MSKPGRKAKQKVDLSKVHYYRKSPKNPRLSDEELDMLQGFLLDEWEARGDDLLRSKALREQFYNGGGAGGDYDSNEQFPEVEMTREEVAQSILPIALHTIPRDKRRLRAFVRDLIMNKKKWAQYLERLLPDETYSW